MNRIAAYVRPLTVEVRCPHCQAQQRAPGEHATVWTEAQLQTECLRPVHRCEDCTGQFMLYGTLECAHGSG